MPKLPPWASRLLKLAAAALCVYVFFRWLLPFVLPFLIALLLAKLLERPVRLLHSRFRMPRAVASAIVVTAGVALLTGLIVFLLGRAFDEINGLLARIPELMTRLPEMSDSLREKVNIWIAAAPVSMQEFLRTSFERIMNDGITIPSSVYSALAGWVSGFAAAVPDMIFFITAVLFSTYFISSDYPGVTGGIIRLFPEKTRGRIIDAKNHLMSTIGKWLRAQGILMLVTFCILLAGFIILRVEVALIPAALIALVDALPVLGAGLCLVPWAIWCLFTGQAGVCIGLLVIFAVVVLVRGIAEPRLVGRQVGLGALPTFIAMYVGFKAIGVGGMVAFPILAMMTKQLWDSGYLRLK